MINAKTADKNSRIPADDSILKKFLMNVAAMVFTKIRLRNDIVPITFYSIKIA